MGLLPKPLFQEVKGAPLDEASLSEYGCDISFVSDESTPAELLVSQQVERLASASSKHLVWEIFDRVRVEYESGGMIGHPAALMTRIRHAATATDFQLTKPQSESLFAFFDRINVVLLQHQMLSWLTETELKVHLHGHGWERHRTLARFARGPVADVAARQAIWRASRINLLAAPYGAVTANLLEGVNAGALCLMRYCPADVIEKFYPPIQAFCAQEKIATNAQLAEQATPGIREILSFATRTLGIDVLSDWPEFVPHLMAVRAAGRSRSAAVIWPAHYPAVSFSSREELVNVCAGLLYDVARRKQIADDMRRELQQQANRVQVVVNRRLIGGMSPARRDEVAA